jgi:hypothetical protein
MPRDYKDSPAPRATADSRLNHPMLLGIIIGLLLGIVISLAVALWLNRLANPFVDKGKSMEPLPKIGPAQPPPPAGRGEGCRAGGEGQGRREAGKVLGAPALRVLSDPARRQGGERARGEGGIRAQGNASGRGGEAGIVARLAQAAFRGSLLAAGGRLLGGEGG